jgi:S1-C subfamily serine protease
VLPLALLLAVPAPVLGQPCSEPFTTLFERVSPAVVSIQATKINKGKPQRRFETIVGSGVLIERDGHLLTNAHVVDGAGTLTVARNSGERTPAKIVGLDPVMDIALLKIEVKNPQPVVHLGDSSTVKVGGEVVAIGSPIGLDQTMTRGIMSGLNASCPGSLNSR